MTPENNIQFYILDIPEFNKKQTVYSKFFKKFEKKAKRCGLEYSVEAIQ